MLQQLRQHWFNVGLVIFSIGLIAAVLLIEMDGGSEWLLLLLVLCSVLPLLIIIALVYAWHMNTLFPVAVVTLTPLAAIAIFFLSDEYELNFRWRISGYNEVIGLVEKKVIQPDEKGQAILPSSYRWLTSTGSISIDKQDTTIFFPNGDSVGYWAYVYSAADTVPVDPLCSLRLKSAPSHWFGCVRI